MFLMDMGYALCTIAAVLAGTAVGAFPQDLENSPRIGALDVCRSLATDRLSRDGYTHIGFERPVSNDKSAPEDRITGIVNGRRGYAKRKFGISRFSFSCSVDDSGTVRLMDMRRYR
jgi:hypothetical protein